MSTTTTTTTSDPLNSPWPTITLPCYPFLGKIKEDFAAHIAGDMSMVHNVLIRSLNALWHHAPSLSPGSKDCVHYAQYGLEFLALLHLHHEGEETTLFPVLMREVPAMRASAERNLAQHEAFHGAVEALEAYLRGLVEGREVYDAGRMRGLVKDLADPLVEHLHGEIKMLQPEDLKKIDPAIWVGIHDAFERHLKEKGTITHTVTYLLTGHDWTHSPHWPPLPRPVLFLARHVFHHVNPSVWKFAPFTRMGEPQLR